MAISNGPKLGLPINGVTGESWDVDLRRLLRAMDQMPFLSIIAILATPPTTPSNGDAYIVGDSPTDDWAGNTRSIAVWTTDNPLQPTGLWEFYQPRDGWLAYSLADAGYFVFASATWASFASAGLNVAVLDVTSPHPSDPDFSLPHGLGATPRIVIPVSNGGLIYNQAVIADDTNVNLTTTDPTVVGKVFVVR